MIISWKAAGQAVCLVSVVSAIVLQGCVDEQLTGVPRDPSLVIRGYANGCVPEVIEKSSEETDTVIVTFNTLGEDCYPNLVQWGIDMADPIGVDTPQGDNKFRVMSENMANMPPSPALSDFPARAARILSWTPPQVMIEFDPPVQTVEFYYSRLDDERAMWNGQMVDADSMRVYARSRQAGTLFYQTYDTETLYSNVPSTLPPWSVWSTAKLSATGDKIEWLWFDGGLAIDNLKVTRTPLRCTPASVVRGQTVTCVVSSSSYQVSKWEFFMEDGSQAGTASAVQSGDQGISLSSLDGPPTVEWISNSKTWAGPVGVGGTVKAHVTDGSGNPRVLTSRFQVTYPASPWQLTWKYRRGTTAPVKLTIPDHDPDTVRGRMGMNCPEQSCQLSKRLQPDAFDSTSRTFTPLYVTVGMNKDLWFVHAIHFNMERVGNLNPGMLSTGSFMHTFTLSATTPKQCRQGLGVNPKATSATANWWRFNNACGYRTLTGRNMTGWVDGVWAHEEFGRNGGQGHESLARAEAAKSENDPYLAIQQLWAWDSLGLVIAVREAATPISDRITDAAADPKPFGNLKVNGEEIWYWKPGAAWSLHPITSPDL